MTLGETLKHYRIKKGLSQKALGEKLGMPQQMVAQYESGKRKPKIETQEKIANVLGVPIEKINPSIGIGKVLAETPGALDDLIQSIGVLADVTESSMINEMIEDFHDLNPVGKKEAAKRVKELTYLPEYKKDK